MPLTLYSAGETETTEYHIWQCMIQRCTNPNKDGYRKYGARGIGVCWRWRSYKNFLADMGRRPSSKHSLDRIDGSRGYSPENCRWATHDEQNRNKSCNRWIEHDGLRMVIADWSRKTGLTPQTIAARLDRGWDPSRALTQSPRGFSKPRG